MLGNYSGYSYLSATDFIEQNKELLKKHISWDSWEVDVKDDDKLCFLDDDFALPKAMETLGAPRSTYTFKAELNDTIVQIPAWRLFDSYEQKEFVFPNEYDALFQAKKFLGQAWRIKCIRVFSRYCFGISLLLLSPAEEQVRAMWEKKKMCIQRDMEIDAYKEQIYTAYNNAMRANTKIEEKVVCMKTEFIGSGSRFTWGEGYQEYDTYKDTVEYLEREYFKGLLLNERRYTKEYLHS